MRRACILYVDDHPHNRLLVRKLLSAAGHEVHEATDGLAGIEAARALRPDLILMDVSMPGLDGHEAATRIKAMPELAAVPIVALTAHTLDGDRERALVAGCDGYIAKPVDPARFAAQVQAYLDGQREQVAAAAQTDYLQAYSRKLVERLEDKVRELTGLNRDLEARVAQKVHELQQAQQQLVQSEKMAGIGSLAAGVAHEINNPVGYVYSNLGSLQQYLDGLLRLLAAYEEAEVSLADPGQRAGLAALRREVDLEFMKEDIVNLLTESRQGMMRVKEIVQDLKDFSHPDEGEWQWADLQQGIESTLNIVHHELKYKAEVVREYGELPLIECQAAALNQVFLNLLVNAAQAIETRGRITIRTGTHHEAAFVEIADSGRGIAPEHLNRLFEPFFTTKPPGQGTGLGLSLSWGIVERHGGRIEVESTPGAGATFRVWLPLRRAEAQSQTAALAGGTA